MHLDQDGYATLVVDLPLLGRALLVRFKPHYAAPPQCLTAQMVAVLNDALALPPAKLATAKQLLWADCLDCLKNSSYGVVALPGETELKADQREFGIYTAGEAYAQSYFTRLAIPEAPGLRH